MLASVRVDEQRPQERLKNAVPHGSAPKRRRKAASASARPAVTTGTFAIDANPVVQKPRYNQSSCRNKEMGILATEAEERPKLCTGGFKVVCCRAQLERWARKYASYLQSRAVHCRGIVKVDCAKNGIEDPLDPARQCA
jgi:hypothetical protein